MALADTARLVATLELKDEFSRTAAKADRTLDSLGRRTGTLSKIGQEAGRGLQTAGRNLVFLGAAAGALLTTQIKAGIDSLVELEEAAAQTNARIEATGGAANVTAEEVRGLAVELENLTTIDDKAIQRGQNMLLTFTNIRNEVGEGNDIFNQATESVLDLATAMGTEPEQAALQLGKALNDPVRGLTALRRVGIQFTEQQERQIEKMVEAGDVMGAQKVILAELNKEFGGSARAFAEGPGAAQRRFADAVEDGQQALARGLLPVIERFSRMAQDAFGDPKVIAGIEAFGQGLGEGIEQLIDTATKLPWEAIGSSLKIAGTGAKAVLDAFTSLPDWVQTAVLTGWGLNKLTGGALGNIAGTLAKSAFGALRGSTPANPVFTKEVGLGGAAGGVPAAAAGRGLAGAFGSALTRLFAGGAAAFIGIEIGKAIGQPIYDAAVKPAEEFYERQLAGATSPGALAHNIDALTRQIDDFESRAPQVRQLWQPLIDRLKEDRTLLQNQLDELIGPGSQFNPLNPGGTPGTSLRDIEFDGTVDDIPRVRDEINALRQDNRAYDANAERRFGSLEQRLLKDSSFAQELTPDRFLTLLARTSEFGERGVGTSIEHGPTTGRDPFGRAFLALAQRLPDEHLEDRRVIGELERHIVAAEEVQAQAIKDGDLEAARKLQKTIDGIHALLGSEDKTTRAMERLERQQREHKVQDAGTAARTAQHLKDIESVEKITSAHTATVAGKDFSPNINVGVDVFSTISVSDVVRASIHTRTASGFRGGNSEI